MAKQNINVGTAANDKKGDSLRAAFVKVNANFTELYTELGLVNDVTLSLGAFEFAGSTISTTDSTAIVIDQATTVTSNLNVGGDILPSVANGGDLGSSTLPWRSLYVSQSTIYLGGTALSIDSQGNLLVGGQSIADVGTAAWNSITGKPTFATVATTGAYTDLTGKPTIPTLVSQLSNDSGFLTSVGNISNIQSEGDINIEVNLSDSTKRIWQFGEDGDLILPAGGDIKNSTGTSVLGGSVSSLVNGAYTASLGNTGALTLPAGGVISEGGGLSGAIKLTPAGGANANQALLIYPTAAAEGDHIHLTAGGGSTELYLGDDLHFVKLTSDGFVVIKADDGVNGAVWGFSPDGTTSIPGDIKSDSNINIEINLTDSTLRRWQFGEDGALTLPSVGKINNGAYDWTFGSTGNTTFPTGLTLGAPRGVGTVNFTAAVDKEFQIETGTATSGKLWQFGTDGSLTIPGDIRSNGNINIEINLADSTLRRWTFGEDGDLVFPDGTVQNTAWTGSTTVSSLVSGDKTVSLDGGNGALTFTTGQQIRNDLGELQLYQSDDNTITILPGETRIRAYGGGGGAKYEWDFDSTGRTTFPNGVVPAHSYGAAGDKEGMVVFTDPYIYYCKQNYVDNVTDIWVRVAWTGTSW